MPILAGARLEQGALALGIISSAIGLIALSRREMRRITMPETGGPETGANGGG